MTREEAIQILRDTPIDIRSTREDDIHSLYATAQMMAIEALSAEAVQGWIPCSERLPIPPTFCLVTTDGSCNDVIDIALYMSDGWHKASKILAWMPLPKPYREESEVEE